MALENSKDLYSIGKYLTEHLKVAGGYWSLTALAALKYTLPSAKVEELVGWLKTCQNADGGFGGNVRHDSHLTSTHYAILVLHLSYFSEYSELYCEISSLEEGIALKTGFNNTVIPLDFSWIFLILSLT